MEANISWPVRATGVGDAAVVGDAAGVGGAAVAVGCNSSLGEDEHAAVAAAMSTDRAMAAQSPARRLKSSHCRHSHWAVSPPSITSSAPVT